MQRRNFLTKLAAAIPIGGAAVATIEKPSSGEITMVITTADIFLVGSLTAWIRQYTEKGWILLEIKDEEDRETGNILWTAKFRKESA